MTDSLYLPQVDYTSRDYASIRDDLIALIPNFTPQWTSRDANDFGIVLIELFSYLGDLLNYQIDRAANESYINTSTQRDTVLALAKLLNYSPNNVSPASGTVTFSNEGANPIIIPAGVKVSTASDGINPSIVFTTQTAVSLTAIVGSVPGTGTTTAVQGEQVTETIGTADGSANQYFALTNLGVITGGTISIVVGSLAYTKVQYIIDYAADDPVFSTFTDGAGITYILFGDGNSGRIPPNGSSISATYSYSNTAGSLGNVAAGAIENVYDETNGVNLTSVTVTNTDAFSGGADAESTDSIRVNAPAALRTLSRAVSLDDYGQLALQVSGVSKAIAIGTSFNVIVLYIAASGASASTQTFKTTVSDYFVNKIPPATTLQVLDFTPAYPYLDVTIAVLPQYSASNVGAAVQSAIYSLFAFDNVTFNDVISQGDVQSTVKSIDGVNSVTINDYEKLPALYSKSAVTTVVATTSVSATTSITLGSSAGLWQGSAIKSIVSSAGVSLYTYTTPVTTITSVTNTTAVVISTTPTAITIPVGSTITVQGNGGVSDLVCAINEVPVLNKNYISVNTTGGNP
jgi:hypothetical protein